MNISVYHELNDPLRLEVLCAKLNGSKHLLVSLETRLWQNKWYMPTDTQDLATD